MSEKETFIADPDDRRGAETAAILAEKFKPEKQKKSVGRPKKIISDEREKDMWHDAAIAAINTYDIKHPNNLNKAFDFADEYVRQARERMEKVTTS